MSCLEVMYQPFPSSLPYHRGSDPLQSHYHGKYHDSVEYGSHYPHTSTSDTSCRDLEKEPSPKDTRYLASNCVLLIYYSGDISTVVDEHFSRALSQSSFSEGTTAKSKVSSLRNRPFPPSFWNSNYKQHSSFPGSRADFHFNPGSYIPSLHGFSSFQDPWYHSLSSQTHPYSHRSVHYDLMASNAGRLNPNYGTLLMQQSLRTGQFSGSMPGQCDIGKTLESSRSLYSDHRLAEYPGHSSFAGLDGSLQEGAGTKDLYWV
ncbi:hypothetical protein ScPMuIL_011957 [Solemya velum]